MFARGWTGGCPILPTAVDRRHVHFAPDLQGGEGGQGRGGAVYEAAAVAEQTGRRASGVVAAAAPGRLWRRRERRRQRRREASAASRGCATTRRTTRCNRGSSTSEKPSLNLISALDFLFIHYSIRSRNRQSGAPSGVLLWATRGSNTSGKPFSNAHQHLWILSQNFSD